MTQTQKKTQRSVVPLIEGEHDDLKVVRLNGDQFVLTVRQAISACSFAADSNRFQTQYYDLLEKLYVWVEERKDKASSAYISIGNDGVKLIVVQRELPADFELEDELVELDLDVANDEQFDLIQFSTLLVPKVSQDLLQSFFTSSGQVIPHPQVNAK